MKEVIEKVLLVTAVVLLSFITAFYFGGMEIAFALFVALVFSAAFAFVGEPGFERGLPAIIALTVCLNLFSYVGIAIFYTFWIFVVLDLLAFISFIWLGELEKRNSWKAFLLYCAQAAVLYVAFNFFVPYTAIVLFVLSAIGFFYCRYYAKKA